MSLSGPLTTPESAPTDQTSGSTSPIPHIWNSAPGPHTITIARLSTEREKVREQSSQPHNFSPRQERADARCPVSRSVVQGQQRVRQVRTRAQHWIH